MDRRIIRQGIKEATWELRLVEARIFHLEQFIAIGKRLTVRTCPEEHEDRVAHEPHVGMWWLWP